METINKNTKITLFYIIIAFLFSLAVRMIWVYEFDSVEAFKFNNEFMINTNDGYYWAEGARDILNGFHQPNDLSPIDAATSKLTAFFAKILPFSFESIIFYMSMFLSSLVVIPIILIAKKIDSLETGLIAALVASIAWSYYNRTMVGYYDTDMLNIVLPVFLLWSIIWAVDTNEDKYLIITALDILVYRWWYPASYALEFSFFGLILLYTLIWDRKNLYNYKLMTLMLLAMANFDIYIRFIAVLGVFFVFREKKFDKYAYYILGIALAVFFLSGGFNPIIAQLKGYIFRDTLASSSGGMGLHFFSVMQTVREAGHIPFETFANRISGDKITFVISILGYIYLAYRHKIMLFALPMLGLGFLASVGGLRFTIYAVPVLAFGIAYLITETSKYLPTTRMRYLSMVLMSLLVLYPHIDHVQKYKVPTVLNHDEALMLDKLKSVANREDYVVAWWDYGYPIRYYSDVKTLTDGGKHSGSVNFPVSFILTQPQDVAAKMARLDVEYTEMSFKDKNNSASNIEKMSKDYGFDDVNDFLYALQTDIKLPQKTRDIYLYLPYKMLSIFPTITKFSNIDLMSGENNGGIFFYQSRNFRDDGKNINLGHGVRINKQKAFVEIGNKKIPIKSFVKILYSDKMVPKKQIQLINQNADLSVIFMQNYNTFLVVDERVYNSLYMQLMVFENYDKGVFKKVLSNLHAKIYKLKI